jgi:hypothetical protein
MNTCEKIPLNDYSRPLGISIHWEYEAMVDPLACDCNGYLTSDYIWMVSNVLDTWD